MLCSRTQQGAAYGDQTQDLSIRSLMLYHHYALMIHYIQKMIVDKKVGIMLNAKMIFIL